MTPTNLDRLTGVAEKLLEALDGAVLGQRHAAESLVAAYVAGGHVLLHGIPGVGKTLLARAFASALGVEFHRIQFTPDLMPTDVIGTNVFEQSTGTFRLVRGPVFTQILMADEVNRTPPKTQSALLEAMQEHQVTIDGVTHALAPDFFVIATQNPIEFEGTYPLPEAQLDRFLVRIEMGLPEKSAELEIYRKAVAGSLAGWDADAALPSAVCPPEDASALRGAARRVHVAEELLDYLACLASGVRSSSHVELAVSPRGALALLEASRAWALVSGRDFVTPDDFKRFLAPCWEHRLLLTAESELEGHSAGKILEEVAGKTDVPR